MGSATWATALATRRQVETTPTTGAKGKIFSTNWEELVGGHTNRDGSQDNLDKKWCEHTVKKLAHPKRGTTSLSAYLNGGLGNTSGIDGDDGSKKELTQERRHEDGTQRCGGGHEHRQGDIALGNVRAQVTGLSAVDGSDENHAGKERRIECECLSQKQGENGHHSVAE